MKTKSLIIGFIFCLTFFLPHITLAVEPSHDPRSRMSGVGISEEKAKKSGLLTDGMVAEPDPFYSKPFYIELITIKNIIILVDFIIITLLVFFYIKKRNKLPKNQGSINQPPKK